MSCTKNYITDWYYSELTDKKWYSEFTDYWYPKFTDINQYYEFTDNNWYNSELTNNQLSKFIYYWSYYSKLFFVF